MLVLLLARQDSLSVLSCQYSTAAGYGGRCGELSVQANKQRAETMAKKATTKGGARASTKSQGRRPAKPLARVERRSSGGGAALERTPVWATRLSSCCRARWWRSWSRWRRRPRSPRSRSMVHQRRRTRGKRAGKAVKEAGKAAAAAVGRRLGNEIDEIRKARRRLRAAQKRKPRAADIAGAVDDQVAADRPRPSRLVSTLIQPPGASQPALATASTTARSRAAA